MLWVNKYAPKTIDDLLLKDKDLEIINDWIESFHKGSDKPLMFMGATGTGKTCTADIILSENNFLVKEINANDICGQKTVKEIFTKTINYKNVTEMLMQANHVTAVIIDEIDTLTVKNGEKSIIQDLIEMITPEEKPPPKRRTKKQIEEDANKPPKKEKNPPKNPIICISDDTNDKKIAMLKKACIQINFTKDIHDPNKVRALVDRVCSIEQFDLTDEMKTVIIKNADGDIRKMLIVMQNLYNHAQFSEELTEDTVFAMSAKEVDSQIYDLTDEIINGADDIDECLKNYHYSKFLLPFMVHENYQSAILKKNGEKVEAIVKCSNILSDGDVLQNYIYKNQCWEQLTDYSGIYSCYIPNILINRHDKQTRMKKESINYTSLSSKVSYYKSNMKNIKEIKMKYNLNIDEIFMLSELILANMLDKQPGDQKIFEILNKYGFESTKEIDQLLRINKYNKQDLKKQLTTKFKKTLESDFESYNEF